MEDIRKVFDQLRAEKEALAARSAPLRAERDAVVQELAPLEARRRELDKQIKAVEMPRMAELDAQISALARSLGGLRLMAQ